MEIKVSRDIEHIDENICEYDPEYPDKCDNNIICPPCKINDCHGFCCDADREECCNPLFDENKCGFCEGDKCIKQSVIGDCCKNTLHL